MGRKGKSRPALVGATVALAVVLAGGGCVQRTMTVTSDPPGAMVWMNQQEIGRTPVKRDFTWYGTYDVQLRKEGYKTLEKKQHVIAPIWQWPPFDLFAEFWPGHLRDERHLNYTLQPASTQAAEPDVLLARAEELRSQLQSSKYTRHPTTRSTTAPTTMAATQPAH